MVYQGLIEMGRNGDRYWTIFLLAAMFGSSLTLASFMKLTHSVFLGVPSAFINKIKIKEVHSSMAIPVLVLALLCIFMGVFAYSLPLQHFIFPSVTGVEFSGFWNPGQATILILAGLAIGFIIYLAGNLKVTRECDSFVGGEKLSGDERITGTNFYNTVRDFSGVKRFYMWAEKKRFDIYDLGCNASNRISEVLRRVHTGSLNSYLLWLCIGLCILFVFIVW